MMLVEVVKTALDNELLYIGLGHFDDITPPLPVGVNKHRLELEDLIVEVLIKLMNQDYSSEKMVLHHGNHVASLDAVEKVGTDDFLCLISAVKHLLDLADHLVAVGQVHVDNQSHHGCIVPLQMARVMIVLHDVAIRQKACKQLHLVQRLMVDLNRLQEVVPHHVALRVDQVALADDSNRVYGLSITFGLPKIPRASRSTCRPGTRRSKSLPSCVPWVRGSYV